MLDIQTRIAQLRRPDLLIKAARFGLDDYSRTVHLRRVLRSDPPARPAAALVQLLEAEAIMNDDRIKKQTTYSVARHVEALVAIMAEAQTSHATRPST
jgi:hypothetical protein